MYYWYKRTWGNKAFQIMILIALIYAAILGFSAEKEDKFVQAAFESVFEEDTIIVSTEERAHFKVRLIGVETNYNMSSRKAEKQFEEKTMEFLQSLFNGEAISLEYDIDKRDKYGRDFCYVLLPDGRMVNEILVLEGYAEAATYPPNKKYVDRILTAQETAKANNLGLWRMENVIDPLR